MGSLFFLICFLHRYDFPTFVETTVRTNDMREDHGTAICASYQIGGFQGIMGAAAVAAAFGKFTFWLWGHSYSF